MQTKSLLTLTFEFVRRHERHRAQNLGRYRDGKAKIFAHNLEAWVFAPFYNPARSAVACSRFSLLA